MNTSPGNKELSPEYLKMYQRLLKREGNISLAELNKSPSLGEQDEYQSRKMNTTPGNKELSAEYLKMYQSLLKREGNISLAELNKSPSLGEVSTPSVVSLSTTDPSHIKQTVRIIQSSGVQRQVKQVATPSTSGGSVSLLNTPTSSLGDAGNRILGYKKRPDLIRGRVRNPTSDPYYHRWKHLKKYIKHMVFINAAVCDEVFRYEEKVAKAREERRFLLRKLLHYQTISETQQMGLKNIPTALLKTGSDEMTGIKPKPKKRAAGGSTEKKKQPKDGLEGLAGKPKPKKAKVSGGKLIVPPIPLDSIGRPIFPLTIGDLTIHSIGEIVPFRPGFHTSNSIFPVGYCSTRVYAGLQSPDKQCLYTCKISDCGKGPMFEIVPEDNQQVFRSRFLSECHSQLLRAINQARGAKLVETTGKGPEFFGLSHPVVQNLIQSCPGAKKCNGYKWVKFEVNKNLTIEQMAAISEDPSISHQALKAKIFGSAERSPSNLRTLLTGPALDSH